VSPQAFREIESRAKLVRHLWHEHGELLPLVLCLFVEVELCRLQSMVKPNQRPLWNNKACAWLSGAEFVCDMALAHSHNGKQKQTANFLRFYTGLGQVQLAFDVDDPAQANKSMQVVQQLANDVTASYGTGTVTETVGFLASMNAAELAMRLGKTECAYQHFKDAEHIFSTMQRHSLEPQLHIAYLKARLALASNDHDHEAYVQEYMSLFQYNPLLTHYSRLRELKRLYPKDVPEVSIAKGVAYMDTMFRHLYPLVITV
jgi:hypothetical protein